ncbi:hypothetical protein Pcinc_029045 [Petrolisthes cinctipes]|uniref:Uncharacterized protein n=1 Tax=Petrolisthes cinctipes TaxID=88211 RepID=A0AAE1K4J1_PETCI|nr:hypothetical protein Pcinc_029045 [Petrolisthes cinctipes]
MTDLFSWEPQRSFFVVTWKKIPDDAPPSIPVESGGCRGRVHGHRNLGIDPVHARVGKGYGFLLRRLLSLLLQPRLRMCVSLESCPNITIMTSTSVITITNHILPSLSICHYHSTTKLYHSATTYIVPSPICHQSLPHCHHLPCAITTLPSLVTTPTPLLICQPSQLGHI